jgi:cobaltochelatase CobS
MANVYTDAQVDQYNAKEMRKLLAGEYRGVVPSAFPPQATIAECRAILTGTRQPADVVAEWVAAITPGGGAAVVASVEHATQTPVSVPEPQPVAEGSDTAANAISALRMMMPKAAAEIMATAIERDNLSVRVFELEKELKGAAGVVCWTPPILPAKCGETVKIIEREAPVLLDADDPEIGLVPQPIPGYNLKAWRGVCECGGVVLEQDADDMDCLLDAGLPILLSGPPSVGKTSLAQELCARRRRKMIRFNGQRDATALDFVGCYEAKGGETVWVDGPLVQAMRKGAVLVVDEADHLPSQVASMLHSVLEPGGRLVITSHGGEVVVPHDNFRIIATANTLGHGDDTGNHSAAQVQDHAFLDRFKVCVQVGWPKPAAERAMLRKLGMKKEPAELLVRCATATRKAQDTGDLQYPITLRSTFAVAELMGRCNFSIRTAFALAILNKAPATDRGVLLEITQRHFGADFTPPAGGAAVVDPENEEV